MTRGAPRPGLGGLLALLVLSAVLCVVLAGRTVAAVRAVVGAWPDATGAVLPDVVAAGALTVGAVVAGWYVLTCAAGVALHLARAAGSSIGAAETLVRRWGAPVLRHALVTTAATGLGLSSLGAGAAADQEPPPEDLGWGATVQTTPTPTPSPEPAPDPPAPTRPTQAPATAPGAAPAPITGAEPAPGAVPAPDVVPHHTEAVHTVVPGDSLWRIAAAHLPPGADDAAIAAEWPRWYAANRAVIGPDPDLIHPGQQLQAPPAQESP
ncbi:LysM peptidoglycan-binding domain-containing protein [Georgenia sp. TF02-10]|uniref:LysM peptidoglycan-binding domain-containing protein n=1 Tax=Georgenia sp. TF02-10 TaxID=2917725 RepID=UPI001FA7D30F|nr:LysM peptidoglycan-binding domain-containing protein [Georgenia sp. TF02-10]UNX55829.1 LysM peptidoglycan-binding domain-containing protein [Georgenia sp. TF02-10]